MSESVPERPLSQEPEPPDGPGAERAAEGLEAVDGRAYKAAMRHFAAGVTIVTTRLAMAPDLPLWGGFVAPADERAPVRYVDHAMTATAFSAVSLEPPLVLVCVDVAARIHQALALAPTWGVSVLPDTPGARRTADWLATRGRPLADQLGGVAVVRRTTGVALLANSLARLECRTTGRVRAGDHTVVIGEVVTAETGELEAGELETGSGPLVHVRGGYAGLESGPGR